MFNLYNSHYIEDMCSYYHVLKITQKKLFLWFQNVEVVERTEDERSIDDLVQFINGNDSGNVISLTLNTLFIYSIIYCL
jgi:hypothetical protein